MAFVDNETKIQALADYFYVDANTIAEEYENDFVLENGEEYLVVTEDEAYDCVKDDIENIVDDIGLDAFTESFQQWIVENALEDTDWFDDAMREHYESYADDIIWESEEYNSGRYREELIDAGLIDEDDTRTDSEIAEDDELKEDFVEYLCGAEESGYDWYVSDFGEDSLSDIIKNGTISFDFDKIAEEAIKWDGIAHFLARYDRREHEIGKYDGEYLFAYRIN